MLTYVYTLLKAVEDIKLSFNNFRLKSGIKICLKWAGASLLK